MRSVYSPDPEILQEAKYHGTKKWGQIEYRGVLWTIMKINNPLYVHSSGKEKVDTLLVEIPPKCKNCKTNLFEYIDFFGRHVWECKRCGFLKKTSESFLIVGSHALEIAKSEIRDKSPRR